MSRLIRLVFLCTALSGALAAQTASGLKYVYWSPDKKQCPICDSIRVDGNTLFGFETPEFDLVITGEVYEDKIIYSQVLLSNKSQSRIELDPAQARLALYKTRDQKVPQEFRPLDPVDAAKKVKGSQKLKNYFISWAAHMNRQTIFVDSEMDGRATVITPTGRTATIDYEGQSRSSVSAPNERALQSAEAEIAERNRQARSKYNQVIDEALRANTVFPDKMVKGNVYFPLVKGSFVWIAVRVGDTVYATGFNIEK